MIGSASSREDGFPKRHIPGIKHAHTSVVLAGFVKLSPGKSPTNFALLGRARPRGGAECRCPLLKPRGNLLQSCQNFLWFHPGAYREETGGISSLWEFSSEIAQELQSQGWIKLSAPRFKHALVPAVIIHSVVQTFQVL